MESQKVERVKKLIQHKLHLFLQLGSDGGLCGDRVWVLLDKSTKKTQKLGALYVSLLKIIGISVSDFEFVYGKKWKGKFLTNGELSPGLYAHGWKNGSFITVSDEPPPGFDNSPEHGLVIGVESENERKVKENFRQKERDSQQSASPDTSSRAGTEPTPSPLSTTPSSTSRTSPPSTASSSRPALPSTTPSTRSAPASTTPSPGSSDPTSDPTIVQWATPCPSPSPSPTLNAEAPVFADEESKLDWIEKIAFPVIKEYVEQTVGELLSNDVQFIANLVLTKK